MPDTVNMGGDYTQPVRQLTTEHAAAIVVIGALVLLILIRRGWGGSVGASGIGSINVGR